MKTTGVIRRIDELGRIVIPKEIRKNLRIKDGENIEILIDNDNVILKRFSEMNRLTEMAENLVESIHTSLKKDIIICDSDIFIAVAGNLKKEIIEKQISNQLIDCLQNRVNITDCNEKILYLVNDHSITCNYCLSTIISNGDALGMVIVLSDTEKIKEEDNKICQLAANFLSKMLED